MSLIQRIRSLTAAPRRFARSAVHELRTRLARRALPDAGPRVVIFPSNLPWDPASWLRAYCVAPELARLGWRVLVVPEPLTLRQRQRILRLEQPDVVLLQQTRHLLNRPQLYPQVPCVVDADDADCLDPRHEARIGEAAGAAAAVVGGNRFVASWLGRHNPNAHVIWTCTPERSEPVPVPPAQRRPVLAWAHASPLGYPHEAALVAAVVRSLAAVCPFEFWLFGCTESEAGAWLAPLRAAGATCRAVPPMPYDEYLRVTGQCAVGIQPVCLENPFSQGKSFGKVLAYLQGQVAVVASRAVDHPLFFRDGENGHLVTNEVDDWVRALRLLLTDPAHRERVAVAGARDFAARLTSGVHARLLDPILRAAIRRGAPGATGVN